MAAQTVPGLTPRVAEESEGRATAWALLAPSAAPRRRWSRRRGRGRGDRWTRVRCHRRWRRRRRLGQRCRGRREWNRRDRRRPSRGHGRGHRPGLTRQPRPRPCAWRVRRRIGTGWLAASRRNNGRGGSRLRLHRDPLRRWRTCRRRRRRHDRKGWHGDHGAALLSRALWHLSRRCVGRLRESSLPGGPSYPARLARALGSRSGATNRQELSSPCRSRRPPALSVIPSGPGRRSPREPGERRLDSRSTPERGGRRVNDSPRTITARSIPTARRRRYKTVRSRRAGRCGARPKWHGRRRADLRWRPGTW